jgi:hypothetical protein
MNDAPVSSVVGGVNAFSNSVEKEMPQLNLQNYHPSLIESYREKILLNHEQKFPDASLLHKISPAVFSTLHPLHNQYSKSINLSSLHESLTRVQTSIMDDHHQQQQQQQQQQHQNMRINNLYSLAANNALQKSHHESIVSSSSSSTFKTQSAVTNVTTNDKNNNKNLNSSYNDKTMNESHFEAAADKSSHIIHLNTKTGVSLKCAYCEAREDFKSR